MAIIVKPTGGQLSDNTPTDVSSVPANAGAGSLTSRDDHRHNGAGFATSDEVSPITDDIRITIGAGITPGVAPAGSANAVRFSPDGTAIAVGHGTTPFLSVYPWGSGAFGTKAVPASVPDSGAVGVEWHPDGDVVACSYIGGDQLSLYPWDGAALGTEIVPTSAPTGTPRRLAFSPDGAFLAIATQTSPYVHVYPWNGATLGTPITQDTSGLALDVAWSSDGAYIAVSHQVTPFVSVYPWTGSFGTKIADPASLPPGQGSSVAFSADDSLIAVGGATNALSLYPWTGAFGTKVVPISGDEPPATVLGVKFSRSGSFLGTSGGGGTSLRAYPVTVGGKLASSVSPASPPAGGSNDCDFSPDGAYLAAAHSTTPFVSVYPGDRMIGF